jgi:hypothetical protein
MKDGHTRSIHASWLAGEGEELSGGTLESSD